MKRREFLRKGLALGATALLPNVGITANVGILSSVVEPSMPEPLIPIWEAAVGGHWGIVKEWLRLDPTLINVTDEATLSNIYRHGTTSLFHLAARLNPDVDFLKYLVSLGADVNAKDIGGGTPLDCAAERNSLEVLQYLISESADVDVSSLLYTAADSNSLDVLQYLVAQGADTKTENSFCRNLLHRARGNSLDVFQYLVAQGVDVNESDCEGTTPLNEAIVHNSVEVVQYLISQSSNVNVNELLSHVATRRSPEHVVEMLRYLVSLGGDVKAKDKYGNTPLHYTALGDGFSRVAPRVAMEYLISAGADIHAKNYRGWTPVHYAAATWNTGSGLDALKYLVSMGADIHAKNYKDWTPLHMAANVTARSDVDSLGYLISQGIDVNTKNKAGKTPLHLAVERTSDMNVVNYLISQGAEVNVCDAMGRTPLHEAALWKSHQHPDMKVLTSLILQGADVTAKDKKGKTALDIACTEESKQILLEAMTNNKKGVTHDQEQYRTIRALRFSSILFRREHMFFRKRTPMKNCSPLQGKWKIVLS